MSLKLGMAKMPVREPRDDKERDKQKAIVEDADKTEGKDRDAIHGDGATLDDQDNSKD
jgi:hypothetical protein